MFCGGFLNLNQIAYFPRSLHDGLLNVLPTTKLCLAVFMKPVQPALKTTDTQTFESIKRSRMKPKNLYNEAIVVLLSESFYR